MVIPTYNERDNLPGILARLHGALPGIHVLVVDDSSPDGTGELADQLSAGDTDGRVHVLHRTVKDGLGKAYLAGFAWGLARTYTVIIEMDADGSRPRAARLPARGRQRRCRSGHRIAICSRRTPGELAQAPRMAVPGANTYARLALGAHIHDITAGFRAYRREVLDKISLATVDSAGYCFQIDLAWRTVQAGFDVREVPITFTEREVGESKMDGGVMTEAFMMVARWGVASRLAQLRRR